MSLNGNQTSLFILPEVQRCYAVVKTTNVSEGADIVTYIDELETVFTSEKEAKNQIEYLIRKYPSSGPYEIRESYLQAKAGEPELTE